MKNRILNRALKQNTSSVDKLFSDNDIVFKSINTFLLEYRFTEEFRCVYNKSSFVLGLYKNDELIHSWSFTGKNHINLVKNKVKQLKDLLNE